MPKKHQPQAQKNLKGNQNIVDQQNDPFLRGLYKKVRNINKKLSEIAQLEHKDNLKAEQIEKINRKDALIDERSRIEETANCFKASLVEHAEHYRNVQLKELQHLAKALAVYHTSPKFHQHAKLAQLWNGLHTFVEGSNLNQVVEAVDKNLKAVANDIKLQKAIHDFINENGELPVKAEEEEEEIERATEEAADKVVVLVEELVNQKGEDVGEIDYIEKIHNGVVEEIDVVVVSHEKQEVEKTDEKKKTQQPKKEDVQTPKEEKTVAPEQNNEQKQTEKKREYRERSHRDNRNNREYRDKREDVDHRRNRGEDHNYRGRYDNRKERNFDKPYDEKRQYRPKYERREEKNQKAQDDSDSESSPDVRQFRKEEIRKLQEEGFTVVGKPKPKARDQQRYYEHTHGRKQHNEAYHQKH